MTQLQPPLKRKPGRPAQVHKMANDRPPLLNASTIEEAEEQIKQLEEESMNKVGHFIVVNTPTVKGVRVNLDKIRTYGKAGRDITDVQLAWDNGTSSTYTFGTEKEAYAFLELLDEHCL